MKEGNLGQHVGSTLLALVLALALLIVATPSAFAAGGEMGDTVEAGGGGTSQPGGNGGGSSTGGSSGGGGATTDPSDIRPVYTNYTYKGQNDSCGATSIGWTNRFSSTTEHFASSADLKTFINNWQSLSSFPEYITWHRYGCIYPPDYTDRTYKVVLGADLTIEQVKPEAKVLKSVSTSTRWGDGERSIAAAKASNESRASASVSINDYGTDRLSGAARAQYVTIREYDAHTDMFGGTYTDSIISTSGVFNASVASARGQLDCENGWSDEWLPGYWNFEHADCAPTSTTNTPTYQCVADPGPAVTINGEAQTEAVLFRNGEGNPVTFAAVRPTGLSNLHAERTRWTRNEDGSPWREEAGRKLSVANANFKLSRQAKGQQLFINDTASAWNSGIITDLYVHGTWASGNGLPNVVTPHYSFQGTQQVESVRITGVNADGSWETTSSTQNIEALAICSGTPLSVEFVRAVSGPGK